MKAFVGHSFDAKDEQLVTKILKFLGTTGLKCETGEPAETKSIADKVKGKIINNDIFVGIFTRSNELISGSEPQQEGKAFGTSNWVIQESGYAIGKDKQLIFLVENGVFKFPELQGDMELIFFDRDNLENTFLKLNEMIGALKREGTSGITIKTQEYVGGSEKQEAEKQKEDIKEETSGKAQEARLRLLSVIFDDKDYNNAQEIFEKEVRATLNAEEKLNWEAMVLAYSHKMGDPTAFNRLMTLADKNSGNPKVLDYLAWRYKAMREYDKAKDIFLKMTTLYDIKTVNGREKIVECYKKASICLASEDNYPDAYKLLTELLYKDDFNNYKSNILTGLADISKRSKDDDKYFIYAEGALHFDPSNTDLRFDLAHKYSETGNNKLSLLHYKIHTNTIKTSGGLNNLGVQYESLKLPAKSIESYTRAAEEKETLAMANIAQRYLKEGFIQDAQEEINKALELAKDGIEVHGNIGNEQNKLKQITEDELDLETKIL